MGYSPARRARGRELKRIPGVRIRGGEANGLSVVLDHEELVRIGRRVGGDFLDLLDDGRRLGLRVSRKESKMRIASLRLS